MHIARVSYVVQVPSHAMTLRTVFALPIVYCVLRQIANRLRQGSRAAQQSEQCAHDAERGLYVIAKPQDAPRRGRVVRPNYARCSV